MSARAWPLALVCSLAACTGNPPVNNGFLMTDFFPLDGTRTWEFSNLDETVPYVLDGQLNPVPETDPENRDGTFIHRVRLTARCKEGQTECGEGWKYDYQISADNSFGIRLWGYDSPDTGPVTFADPVVLAKARMVFDDTKESLGIDGHDFVTTFEDVSEDCDEDLQVKWSCARLRLDSDPPGHILAGTWWAVAGYNVVAWQRTGDTGKWRTKDVVWER